MTLLVLSCSATKKPVGENERVPFALLYDGPMWRQVRAAGFPLDRVAAVSALYGFLEPDHPAIWTYDREMDEKAAARICGTGDHVHRFAVAAELHGGAMVFGGEMYRRVADYARRYRPSLDGRINFATGSFLEQRKQLGEWLRSQGEVS